MANLPSPDPGRYGKVHVLRRPSQILDLDAEEKERRRRLAHGEATIGDWELERDTTDDEAQRQNAINHIRQLRERQQREETQRAKRKANVRGWAIVVLLVLIGVVIVGWIQR